MPRTIESLLHSARDAGVLSAAAWAVGDDTRVIDRGILGTLSWDGPPVAEDSRWDLASLTKPIVALAVMSLIETGELTLDDTLGRFVESFAGSDKAGLRVRDLLTHTSGMRGQTPLYQWCRTREEMLAGLRDMPLTGEPGDSVQYTSQGFMLLGFIAESAAGTGLDRLVRERVLAPSGMDETSFGLPPEEHAKAVATEDDPWRGRVVQGEVHDENAVVLGAPAGHAGLFSTLPDMQRLGRMLCAEGHGERGRVLSGRTLRTMIAPRTPHLPLQRALGWQGVDESRSPAGDLIGPRGYGHTGFTGTSFWVDPEARRYVVLLTNRVHPSREGTGIERLRRLVNNIGFSA